MIPRLTANLTRLPIPQGLAGALQSFAANLCHAAQERWGFFNALLLVLVLSAGAAAAGETRYVPGRGLHLFDDKLILGGYLAVEFEARDEEPIRLTLDDFSFFATFDPTEKIQFFLEYELEEVFSVGEDGFQTGDDITSLERLYADWHPNDGFSIRAGKFLTPIGIWNPIHAQPLVWTTTRPIATTRFFGTEMTGVQITTRHRVWGGDLTAMAFGQATDQLAGTVGLLEVRRGGGGRLQFGNFERWHVAASYLRAQEARDRIWKHTAGVDAGLNLASWEITSELAVTKPDQGSTTWSTYLQVVQHIGGGFYPFLRYEHVKLSGLRRNPVIFGMAYKPRPFAVFKLEALLGRSDLGGDGIVASFSMLY